MVERRIMEEFNDKRLENERKNKRAFIKFLEDILDYNDGDLPEDFSTTFKELVNVLQHKSVTNFIFFRMLFDLIITNVYITDDNKSKKTLIEASMLNYKKSKTRNLFTNYIESFDLREIVHVFIRFRNIIEKTRENINSSIHIGKRGRYDVFLSHKYTNKLYNFTLYFVLRYVYNLDVYVDWIVTPAINRKKLSKQTVKVLSDSLRASDYLLFFNLENGSTTNWMAWEVGYFKGLNRGVGIMDITDYLKGKTNVEILSSNNVFKVNKHRGIYEEKSKLSIDTFLKQNYPFIC